MISRSVLNASHWLTALSHSSKSGAVELAVILKPSKFEELDEYSYEPDEIANVTWAKPGDNIDEFYCQMTGYDAGYIYKCKMGKLNEDGAVDESEVSFGFFTSPFSSISLLIG